MFHRKNMGPKGTQIGLTLLGVVLALSGVLTALTGLTGFCPACAMAGRKSLEGPR